MTLIIIKRVELGYQDVGFDFSQSKELEMEDLYILCWKEEMLRSSGYLMYLCLFIW